MAGFAQDGEMAASPSSDFGVGMRRCPLPGHGQVHVWLVHQDRISDRRTFVECRDILSSGERARARRFFREPDSRLYTAAHALMRTTLSRYLGKDPHDWVFATSSTGKPMPVLAEGSPPVHVSISHTAGLAACALATQGPVGVDVEVRQRGILDAALLASTLCPDEIESFRGIGTADRVDRFFEIWTLKEAYLKARGYGVAFGMSRFGFLFDGEGRPRLSLPGVRSADTATWRFSLHRPTSSHQAAVALRNIDGELDVEWRCADPI
ncbi:MAG: 4'-phosphopantetheinyl transferase superfamily protein [bacterium]